MTVHPSSEFAEHFDPLEALEDVPLFSAFIGFAVARVSAHSYLSDFWDETVRGGGTIRGVFMGFIAQFQRISLRPGLRGGGTGAARRNMPVFALFAHSCHRDLQFGALL